MDILGLKFYDKNEVIGVMYRFEQKYMALCDLEDYSGRGSNSRPTACEADVITATPPKLNVSQAPMS